MKDLIPKSLLERAMKYTPLMQRLEARGARILEQKMAVIRNAKRIELQRSHEEERRQAILFQRRKIAALDLKMKQQAKAALSLETLRLKEYPVAVADAVDELEWPSSGTGEEEDAEQTISLTKLSKSAKKAQVAAETALVRPDPFVTAAAGYRESSVARLVCRKCDHTLTRGVRGVHLFSWNDNYHIALNDEIADTISFKDIVDPSELQKSLWKRAKVACPCCGTSVGTLGVTHARMKVMFKGVCVAWRSTSDVINHVNRPTIAGKGSLVPTQVHSVRPVGSSLPSTWLLSNAGLMTHNRRWVLDSSVLNRVVEQLNTSNKTAAVPPISDAEPSPGCVVRASDKEPAVLTPMMKHLALRAMAVENLTLLDPRLGTKGAIDMLTHFENLIVQAERVQPKVSTVVRKEDKVKSSAEVAPVPEEALIVEDSIEEAYELDKNSSLALLRFACLDKLAQMRVAQPPAKAESFLKSGRVATVRQQCTKYLKDGGAPTSFISARMLCSAARVFNDDKDALLAVVNLLTQRKRAFGPAAGAFGRSAEYLRSALEESKLFTNDEIKQAMDACSSPHPSISARFGVEFEPSGFVELFCTHGDGVECNRRATHAPPPPVIDGVPPNVRDPKVRIPTMCRIHAPAGYVATAEGYRGVIPPYEDPLRNKPGHLQVISSGYSTQQDRRGWYPRRNNRIVDVPDPEETTFGPPEPGTLFMGSAWEQNVKVCYTKEDLKEVLDYFDAHIAKAEELTKANGGVPSPAAAIGLDVEWKPEFVYSEDNHVCSVIQIATRDRAFIFDAIALGAELDPLMRRLFRSKDIIKIGHGLGEDLARVAQSISRAVGKAGHVREYFPVESLVELAPLFSKAESKVFAYGTLPSLVSMVEAATGMRLDKRCQMTDWERRPLSPAQIRYAATDAACGFILFDHFSKKIQQATGQGELDIRPYLQTDQGTTLPQRAGMQYSPTLITTSSAGMVQQAPLLPIQMPPQTPSSQFYMYPPPVGSPVPQSPPPYQHHNPYVHHVHHHHQYPQRMGLGHRFPSARLSAVPRMSNRKMLSKQEFKRLRELQNDLISQGVKVDEHAKLEGLEVASEHLQKSLSKVVRDSLVDPPPAVSQTQPPIPPQTQRPA